MRTRPVVAAALLLAGPASAKTADGLTPSVETVCDQYTGAAYGLCNSYCEARDCDDPRVRASDQSCEVTAAQFKRKTGHDLVCTTDDSCTVSAEEDLRSVRQEELPISISVLENDTHTGGVLTFRDFQVSDDFAADTRLEDAKLGLFSISGHTFFTYNACCSAETCDQGSVSVTVDTAS